MSENTPRPVIWYSSAGGAIASGAALAAGTYYAELARKGSVQLSWDDTVEVDVDVESSNQTGPTFGAAPRLWSPETAFGVSVPGGAEGAETLHFTGNKAARLRLVAVVAVEGVLEAIEL